ncbi:unnamed protein product [Lasius platythorax]|uniref:Uncharacterized protein n=1 Tax=Lasius platythorax TaxID=488582 RepID=A0AAV2P7N4_9HYME
MGLPAERLISPAASHITNNRESIASFPVLEKTHFRPHGEREGGYRDVTLRLRHGGMGKGAILASSTPAAFTVCGFRNESPCLSRLDSHDPICRSRSTLWKGS